MIWKFTLKKLFGETLVKMNVFYFFPENIYIYIYIYILYIIYNQNKPGKELFWWASNSEIVHEYLFSQVNIRLIFNGDWYKQIWVY